MKFLRRLFGRADDPLAMKLIAEVPLPTLGVSPATNTRPTWPTSTSITFTLPPGTVLTQGQIEAARMAAEKALGLYAIIHADGTTTGYRATRGPGGKKALKELTDFVELKAAGADAVTKKKVSRKTSHSARKRRTH